jgi:tungstate transport system substrate-binding protein
MNRLLFTGLLAWIAMCVGCAERPTPPRPITLATTTSTRDSGLLDELLPVFSRETGIEVRVVAVGSGQALELGRRGDADLLLTHSPDAEQKFMDEGWGDSRRPVMVNDFVILGPAADEANVKLAKTAKEALLAIAAAQQTFVSRGDDSGTHKKELDLWKAAGLVPEGDWYLRAGSGMAAVLRMANEKEAYTLADRATYLALKKELSLVVVFSGDPQLLNHYSVITINSSKHPHIQSKSAERLAEFLVSPSGQKLIGEFGVARWGSPLFTPHADSTRDRSGSDQTRSD